MRAALVALALVTGCATTQQADNLEQMREAIDAYNHAFRWKAYDNASAFLPADLRAPFLAAYEDEESSLQIEEYRIQKIEVHSERSATVTVRYRYLMLPSVVVQNTTVVQHWQKLAGGWILETEEHSLRELDPGAQPKSPPPAVSAKPEQEGDTQLEVFEPGQAPPDE